MLYGDGAILIILVYFIIVVIVLTLLWRISIALDLIGRHLFQIAKDMKRLSAHFREEGKDIRPVTVKEQEGDEEKE
jgi:hypothetical protein